MKRSWRSQGRPCGSGGIESGIEFIVGILVLLELTKEVGRGRQEAQRKSREEIYGCGERGHEGEEDAGDMGSRGAVRVRACVCVWRETGEWTHGSHVMSP